MVAYKGILEIIHHDFEKMGPMQEYVFEGNLRQKDLNTVQHNGLDEITDLLNFMYHVYCDISLLGACEWPIWLL